MMDFEFVCIVKIGKLIYWFVGLVVVGGRVLDFEVCFDLYVLIEEGCEIVWLCGVWIDGVGDFLGRVFGFGDFVVMF